MEYTTFSNMVPKHLKGFDKTFFYYVTELIIYDVQSFINLLFAFPVAFFFKQYIPVVIGMGFVCGCCKPYFARSIILNF